MARLIGSSAPAHHHARYLCDTLLGIVSCDSGIYKTCSPGRQVKTFSVLRGVRRQSCFHMMSRPPGERRYYTDKSYTCDGESAQRPNDSSKIVPKRIDYIVEKLIAVGATAPDIDSLQQIIAILMDVKVDGKDIGKSLVRHHDLLRHDVSTWQLTVQYHLQGVRKGHQRMLRGESCEHS